MMDSVKNFIKEKPLYFLLLIGLLVRLIAAFTAHGYYAYDDYGKVVYIAWGWSMGENYEGWFVSDYALNDSLRHILYPGIIASFFTFCNFIGITTPFNQMVVIQLFHALYSLTIISLCYKIAVLLFNKQKAFLIGLLVSILWFIPFLSVRTMAEWVSIPPLLFAYYLYYKNKESNSILTAVIIGCVFAFTFTLRYQTAFLILGFGIASVYTKEWMKIFGMALGFIVSVCFLQGLVDYLVCDMPFGKLLAYINYNFNNSSDYISRPVFDYLLIIPGLFLPPIGLFIFFGMFKTIKTHLHIFLGVILFLIFHSLVENKQERFIFTILPLIILIGSSGMLEFFKNSFWSKHPKLIKGFWIFFWVINTYGLVFMTTYYSKKSRVEAALYLKEQKDVKNIIIENIPRGSIAVFPEFYHKTPLTAIEGITSEQDYLVYQLKLKSGKWFETDYILFEVNPDQKLEEERLNRFKVLYPNLHHKTRINGSLVDNFRFKFNRVLKNYEYEIYKTH